MTNTIGHHLSTEALDDVLIGMGTAESESHLAACAQCRARVQAFGANLQLLDETSMAWSRVRAAGMAEMPVPTRARRRPLATMGWTAAGLAALALALPVWQGVHQHIDHARLGAAPQVTATEPDSAAQIAADNKLLEEIDAAVNSNEASPFGVILRTDRQAARHRAQPQ